MVTTLIKKRSLVRTFKGSVHAALYCVSCGEKVKKGDQIMGNCGYERHTDCPKVALPRTITATQHWKLSKLNTK